MTVQDDAREIEIAQMLDLERGDTRGGIDAFLNTVVDAKECRIPIEIKSTSNDSVSTARDVGMEHLEKWRQRIWLFGFYDSEGITLLKLLCLKPSQMSTWIDGLERYIKPDFAIGKQAAARLTLEDLYIVCGQKATYLVEDAKSLHKKQWSAKQYVAAQDLPSGYSANKMLEILRLRAVYLNAVNLNPDPSIMPWIDIKSDSANGWIIQSVKVTTYTLAHAGGLYGGRHETMISPPVRIRLSLRGFDLLYKLWH